MKLTPLAVSRQNDGHIFVLAAPSKEAFIVSYQQHFPKLAEQLTADSKPSIEDVFIRCRQASFIVSIYSEFTQ